MAPALKLSQVTFVRDDRVILAPLTWQVRDTERWLVLGVTVNLLLLGWFKYANFGVDSFNALMVDAGMTPAQAIKAATADAAEALGITAPRLKSLGLIDRVVNEPLGGAHRDHAAMMTALKRVLQEQLKEAGARGLDELLKTRFDRLMSYGRFKEDAA